MSVEKIEALVVGAGQAGLAASEHLGRAGIPHLVLERSRIAERWRTARWDSLVANGPAWHDRFPRLEFDADPDAFVAKDAVADLGVIASMQPVHPPGSSGLPLEPTVSIMGRDRWRDTFPWAALVGAGVPLAFGTDWPTAPLSPFNAIHAALSRQPWAADVPDQRLPFAAVIEAYTAGGAQALFAEDRRGRLAAGMAADLVLLAGDPRALVEDAGACHAALTICAGAIVHEEGI